MEQKFPVSAPVLVSDKLDALFVQSPIITFIAVQKSFVPLHE